MGVHRQAKGKKGSLKWVQRLINERPALLESPLRQRFGIQEDTAFSWKSPLAEDGYAEYRDADFLRAVGKKELAAQLSEFWPRGGPQWDALGLLSDGTAILVEAKAHISEAISHLRAADQGSIRQIEEALRRTKEELGVRSRNPWHTPFYQYANRVAHLHFLRNMCGSAAFLVFVDFVGDREVGGPRSEDEWKGATALIHAYLGIRRTNLTRSMAHVPIGVDALG